MGGNGHGSSFQRRSSSTSPRGTGNERGNGNARGGLASRSTLSKSANRGPNVALIVKNLIHQVERYNSRFASEVLHRDERGTPLSTSRVVLEEGYSDRGDIVINSHQAQKDIETQKAVIKSLAEDAIISIYELIQSEENENQNSWHNLNGNSDLPVGGGHPGSLSLSPSSGADSALLTSGNVINPNGHISNTMSSSGRMIFYFQSGKVSKTVLSRSRFKMDVLIKEMTELFSSLDNLCDHLVLHLTAISLPYQDSQSQKRVARGRHGDDTNFQKGERKVFSRSGRPKEILESLNRWTDKGLVIYLDFVVEAVM